MPLHRGATDRPDLVTSHTSQTLRIYIFLDLPFGLWCTIQFTAIQWHCKMVCKQGSVGRSVGLCSLSSDTSSTTMLCCSAPWQHPVIFRPMALTTLPVPVTLVLPGRQSVYSGQEKNGTVSVCLSVSSLASLSTLCSTVALCPRVHSAELAFGPRHDLACCLRGSK